MISDHDKIVFKGDLSNTTKEVIQISDESENIARTIEMPEPNFDEIKHLISDKPLRFMQRSRLC